MIEEWRDISGYEGLYKVSDRGQIYSLSSNKMLAIQHDKRGYPRVSISKNGELKSFRIHRLVAAAFLNNPENKRTVNHKNGVKTDNSVENLEYASDSENVSHAYKTGLKIGNAGSRNAQAKLDEMQVLTIITLLGNKTGRKLAEEYNVSPSMVALIKNNKKWKHLPRP